MFERGNDRIVKQMLRTEGGPWQDEVVLGELDQKSGRLGEVANDVTNAVRRIVQLPFYDGARKDEYFQSAGASIDSLAANDNNESIVASLRKALSKVAPEDKAA